MSTRSYLHVLCKLFVLVALQRLLFAASSLAYKPYNFVSVVTALLDLAFRDLCRCGTLYRKSSRDRGSMLLATLLWPCNFPKKKKSTQMPLSFVNGKKIERYWLEGEGCRIVIDFKVFML